MSRHFTATILLNEPWPLDVDTVAAAVEDLYPEIGRVEAMPGQSAGLDSGLLRIDGGHVVLTSVPHPVPHHEMTPDQDSLRSWDPSSALRGHRAHLEVSCGGRLPGLEGAEAYAAAVHFVAAAASAVAPASAIFWKRGCTLSEPGQFRDQAARLIKGRMPLGAWVGFAAVTPKGYSKDDVVGMVTHGLRPFIGRELELAARPCTVMDAFGLITSIARQALDHGMQMADGQRLEPLDGSGPGLKLRERRYWLRRDLSAFVLVADDSVIDPLTLKPKRAAA